MPPAGAGPGGGDGSSHGAGRGGGAHGAGCGGGDNGAGSGDRACDGHGPSARETPGARVNRGSGRGTGAVQGTVSSAGGAMRQHKKNQRSFSSM